MKRAIIACIMGSLCPVLQAQLPVGSATLGLTLTCAGGTGNRSSVAYNPNQQLYYCVNAGSSGYPIETFDAGGAPVSTTNAGFDYRGSWWNPNTGKLEGNGYNTLGIWTQDLDLSFYPLNTGVNVIPSTSGPNLQSNGDYDYRDNEILYYDNGSIYRHSRNTNTLIASVAITGLPVAVSNLNINSVAYTGVVGMEAGVYDHVNKAFYFINKVTGAYAGICQLPVSAPAANSFKLGFANGYLWVFDGTARIWNGYKTVTCSYTTSSIVVEACGKYTVPSGLKTYTTSGIYIDTLTNAAGCDSLITIDLTIVNNPTGSTLSLTACKQYTVPSGDETYTISGIYSDTIPNSEGCDSVITINLTINKVNTAVSQDGHLLTSNATDAIYQWVDCSDEYKLIPGATDQNFTATSNGVYAVIITQNGCTDTSACYPVNTVGIDHRVEDRAVRIFPNPANDHVYFQFGSLPSFAIIEIISITGKSCFNRQLTSVNTNFDLSGWNKGIYFVRINTPEGTAFHKLIIE